MFNITEGMANAWKKRAAPLATPNDIALIENNIGTRLPGDYVAFVTQYGFVEFGRDAERRFLFSYVIEQDGQRITRQRQVQFMFAPDKLITRWRYMTTADDPGDETRPSIPSGFVPVAGDAGFGAVLLDISHKPGQVWFWPEDNDRWGLGNNVALGFVADTFEDFINSLRPDPL